MCLTWVKINECFDAADILAERTGFMPDQRKATKRQVTIFFEDHILTVVEELADERPQSRPREFTRVHWIREAVEEKLAREGKMPG